MGLVFYYFTKFADHFILIYSALLFATYFLLSAFSAMDIQKYMRRNSFIDYRDILTAPSAPSISIIAPAYNESKNIVENVRSLLNIHYVNFEVIIVNDGSKDDTLQLMIDAYELEAAPVAIEQKLASKPIVAVYKSKIPSLGRLTVIDKVNGGKADALNAGINISRYGIFAAIDVDCILEYESLLKMVKPFMEQTESDKVIAVGGVVRIANSCEVNEGKIIRVNLPDQILPRIQVLEYIRAFLLGRMAWSRLNGLILISGAFGMFDKKIAIDCGGYNHRTVGEDMELVIRMRRYMEERKKKYRVVYLPDPLCWTEAPSSLKILSKQRNRWTRGTAETLWIHRKLIFNPRYHFLGMISMPFWFLFEWLAPIVEMTAFLYLIMMAFLGILNLELFITLFCLIYVFAIMYSTAAILFEELSFHQYKRKRDIFRLLGTAFIEPLIIHPLTVYYAIRGNLDLMTGVKNWGEMTRAGFARKK
ncbi:MAG: glycosyltransferase family 2 protein [Bacteroidetes bacterium]|nr:glycosyltransferase family 2 protein [Bacteroidota bacterium]MBP6650371.1 glycosyltransferase family 2 protein [Bacteroidia bacterium]